MKHEIGDTAYGWVRTSMCCDEEGGVYLNSVNHLHRTVWDGKSFSFADKDGAWKAEYRNGTGSGSGTTPSLMGDDPNGDRFVVIGDGDEIVNITLFWRDSIPDDWKCLPNAPSRRIAGLGAANMGDSSRESIQTEQSITVAGYGAMTVNNEPSSRPSWLPQRANRLLSFFLGHYQPFTPYGLHKYEWDPNVGGGKGNGGAEGSDKGVNIISTNGTGISVTADSGKITIKGTSILIKSDTTIEFEAGGDINFNNKGNR